MKRGEVRWYTFAAPDKRRPVLILTRNTAIRFLNTVTIAPLTSTIRAIPSEVALGCKDGLPHDCVVNLDHLQTVPQAQVGAFLAALTPDKMRAVEEALAFALGFAALPPELEP